MDAIAHLLRRYFAGAAPVIGARLGLWGRGLPYKGVLWKLWRASRWIIPADQSMEDLAEEGGAGATWTDEKHTSFLNCLEDSFVRWMMMGGRLGSGAARPEAEPLRLDRHMPDGEDSTRDCRSRKSGNQRAVTRHRHGRRGRIRGPWSSNGLFLLPTPPIGEPLRLRSALGRSEKSLRVAAAEAAAIHRRVYRCRRLRLSRRGRLDPVPPIDRGKVE